MQQFLNLQELPQALAGRKTMLVCGGSMDKLRISEAQPISVQVGAFAS